MFLTKKIKKTAVICILLLTAASTGLYAKPKYKLPKNNLTILKADGSSVTVNAELAKKEEERNYGFMNRKNIPDGTGMLFIFEADQYLSFWMKNTPTPLSIAYIDSSGVIKNIYDMTPYSLSSVKSTGYVRYALEVPQGWYEKNNVHIGDTIITENGSKIKTLQ